MLSNTKKMAVLFRAAMAIALLVASTLQLWADVTEVHEYKTDGRYTISIHSEIKKGDSEAFTDLTKAVANDRQIWVNLDSPGGDVVEAMRIGRLIRERFMFTAIMPERKCASACVFILMAGVYRLAGPTARVGIHRPKFDSEYFADLTPDHARTIYDSMLREVQKYFLVDMSGSDEAFRLMMAIPSDQLRWLTYDEVNRLNLLGADPAWDEYLEAQRIKEYGLERWSFIKQCFVEGLGSHDICKKKAYERYPAGK
jgi:hypothetical protein